MCGIAGLVDFGNRPSGDLAAALSRMQAALAHRGPDGAGLVMIHGSAISEGARSFETRRERSVSSGPAVGMAHLRLAIIDLSPSGHQPMASGSGADWLTYNGELYNYRGLRAELAHSGARLRSHSDTEVLLESLIKNGVATLSALRGMFAFAWWSEKHRRLMLARDRFGIKPLFVARPARDLVLYASEPRAIAASGYVNLEPEDGMATEFLARGSMATRASFWKGIDAVPPGSYMTVDEGGTKVDTYWSLDAALLGQTELQPAARVAASIRPAIVGSVEAHLVSDVPVGIFLSGGLDSTAILAAAREVTSGPIQTFTVTMPGSPLDEAEAARQAARHFGGEHVEVSLDDLNVDDALEEFFSAMQNPSFDGFNTFLVARAARAAGARVVLSGVGADELFGGYGSFGYVPRLHRMRRRYGSAARLTSRLIARLAPRFSARLRRVFPSNAASVAETWWRSRQLFTDAELASLTGLPGPPAPFNTDSATPFDQVRYCEFRFFLESQLLGDADVFTMCRALELRTPFVDHVLLEATAAAGRWNAAPGRSHKATLFAHLEGLHLPGILDRRKQGFVLPFDAWMREALERESPSRLADLATRLNQPAYRPFVRRFRDGGLHWSRLWALYVLDRSGHSRVGDPTVPHHAIAS